VYSSAKFFDLGSRLRQVAQDFSKVYFRDVEIDGLTRRCFASGRIRSCDQWMFGVNFEHAGFTAT
jgi:hypothetical protein